MPYRASQGNGLFGSHVAPMNRPLLDVGDTLDAVINGASTLIRNAYLQKRQARFDQQQQEERTYQHQRDSVADQRYDAERHERQIETERRHELDKGKLDLEQRKVGYTPPRTETQAVPAGQASITPLEPNPSLIDRAMRGSRSQAGGVPGIHITPRAGEPGAPIGGTVPVNRTANVEIPGQFDPTKSESYLLKAAERSRIHDAMRAAGSTEPQAVLGAERPDLADNIMYPTGQAQLHAAADGTAMQWDATTKRFVKALDAEGKSFKLHQPSDPVATHQANRLFDQNHPLPARGGDVATMTANARETYFKGVSDRVVAAADARIPATLTGPERAQRREQLAAQLVLQDGSTKDLYGLGLTAAHVQAANQRFGERPAARVKAPTKLQQRQQSMADFLGDSGDSTKGRVTPQLKKPGAPTSGATNKPAAPPDDFSDDEIAEAVAKGGSAKPDAVRAYILKRRKQGRV